MPTVCPKCHQLYEALESEAHSPDRRCPRCAAFGDLLAACEAFLDLTPVWPDDEENEHAQAEVHAARLDAARAKARAAVAKARTL